MNDENKLKRLVLIRNLLWALAPLLAAGVIFTGWRAFRAAPQPPEETFRQEAGSELPELDGLLDEDGEAPSSTGDAAEKPDGGKADTAHEDAAGAVKPAPPLDARDSIL